MNQLRKYILISGLVLFIAALCFPSIGYKPDKRSNPKLDECSFAVQYNVMCESFAFGGFGMSQCGVVDAKASGKTYVDKQKILDYCQGWNEPVAGVSYGFSVLLLGALGIFVGVFAWFANPLMLLALLLAKLRKRVAAIIFSIALALNSFALKAIPFNESSMDPSNLNYVDHFGLGFYLWMASLVMFSGYCFLKRKDVKASQ